jgi:hypothetical protein
VNKSDIHGCDDERKDSPNSSLHGKYGEVSKNITWGKGRAQPDVGESEKQHVQIDMLTFH